MIRYLLPLALFLGLVVLLATGLYRDPRLVPSPFIGRPAPALELPSLKNEDKRIANADLRGRVQLVNVWASWCVACREEHEILLRLARETRLPILGFNYKDRREDALAWLESLGDPYAEIAFDSDGRAGIEWGVYGVPETFLVDAQGVVRYKHVGPLTWETIEEKLMPLIRSLEKGP